jgi:hypothetical protein
MHALIIPVLHVPCRFAKVHHHSPPDTGARDREGKRRERKTRYHRKNIEGLQLEKKKNAIDDFPQKHNLK